MPTSLIVPGDAIIQGSLILTGSLNSNIARSNLAIEAAAVYPLPWTAWRVWDALATLLPGTPASDDLGLIGGTWGTNTPSIQTGDLKNAGATTRYARTQFQLPPEYVTGQAVTLRLHSGMLTTVASSAATIDLEAYKSNRESLVSGSDLCSTAAQSINSLTMADKDFTINPSGLVAGDTLDLRIAIAVNDSGTGTAVIGCLGSAEMLLNIRG